MTAYPDNNPKTAIGANKVPMHLVPPSAKYFLALALADGARKYGPYNWRDADISVSVYKAALERHMDAFWDGEDNAADSGVHHVAHAMACCALLLDAMTVGRLNDDRPTAGTASELQARYIENAVIIPPPEYDPDDVAFRKSALDELAAESQAWGMYDGPPDLRHIGIGDVVPTAGRVVPVLGGGSAKGRLSSEWLINAHWDRRRDKTAPGTPADIAYLASFGPNDGGASSGMTDISCDGRGNVALSGHARRKTDGAVTDVRYSATNAAISQHPMAAEALRDHDERLHGPESHL